MGNVCTVDGQNVSRMPCISLVLFIYIINYYRYFSYYKYSDYY